MRFVIKQIFGILIFVNILFFIRPNSFSAFLDEFSLRSIPLFARIICLSAFVLWIIAWNYFLSHWRKTKNTEGPILPSRSITPRQAYIPRKMKVVSGAVLRINPNATTFEQKQVNPSPQEEAVSQNPPVSSQLESDLAELSNGFWGNLDIGAFLNVQYEGQDFELIYSSKDKAIIVKVLSDDGVWTVEPSTGNFINASTVIPAPVALLKKQQQVINHIEPSAEVLGAVLLMRGTIQDEPLVQNYLTQHNILLIKFDESVASQAKTIAQVLQENFEPAITTTPDSIWEELDEQEEQRMLEEKQEASYDEKNTSDTQ